MKLTPLLLLPLFAFTTADTWQPFAVDGHVSVQLPVAPTEVDVAKYGMTLPAGAHMFMAMTPTGGYQLMGPMPVDSNLILQDPGKRASFYDGVVEGMVVRRGGTLVHRRPFQTQSGEGVAIAYLPKPSATGTSRMLFTCLFLVNRSSYACTFYTAGADSAVGAEQRRRFFNSITVKP